MAKLSLDVAKCKSGAAAGLQRHDQREPGEKHSNKDIDDSRTHLNYDLHNPEKISFTDKINQRIKDEGIESKRALRSDANVMISVVVQAHKEFFNKIGPKEQERFFQESYKILAEKYGKENIITATVHLDEKAPHLHFKFVPITPDHKLRGGEMTNKPHLEELHTIVAERLKECGFDIQRGEPEIEKREHLTPQQFKLQEAFKMAQELSKLESDIEIRSASVKGQEEALKAKEGDLTARHQQLEKETAELQQRLKEVAKPGEVLQISARVKLKEPLFGNRHVELSVLDYNAIYNAAAVSAQAVETAKLVEPLKVEAAKVPALSQEVGSLRNKNMELTKKVETLDKNLTHLQTKTYQKYQKQGLNDKQTAAVMMAGDGISKDHTAKTIASSSPSAPDMSNDAREYGKGIIDAALSMDSKAVALIATLPGCEDIDWEWLSPAARAVAIAKIKKDVER